MLTTAFTEIDRGSYNGLGDVEDAFARLQRHARFGGFLAEFGELVSRHDLCKEVGAFLLHRHFAAGAGEILLELPLQLETGEPALVTAVTPARDVPDYTAYRWRLNEDGAFRPLEYTTDAAAPQTASVLSATPLFVEEYAELLHRYALANLIGLCIPDKAYLTPATDEWLVEVTEANASVITAERKDVEEVGLIPTVWTVSRDARANCANRCRESYFCRDTGRGHDRDRGPHDQIHYYNG